MNTGIIIKLVSTLLVLVIASVSIPSLQEESKTSETLLISDKLLNYDEVIAAHEQGRDADILQKIDAQIHLLEELKREVQRMHSAAERGD